MWTTGGGTAHANMPAARQGAMMRVIARQSYLREASESLEMVELSESGAAAAANSWHSWYLLVGL